jgi:hypothetical protein
MSSHSGKFDRVEIATRRVSDFIVQIIGMEECVGGLAVLANMISRFTGFEKSLNRSVRSYSAWPTGSRVKTFDSSSS